MTPIQQMFLGVGAKKKVYMDDVFSTFVYKGNNGANQIINGVDNTAKSLVWIKGRDVAESNWLFDTIRGGSNELSSNSQAGASTASGYHINTFNDNGFTLQNNGGGSNNSNYNYSSWNFKSAPGFFTCLSYTGNGTNRVISHDLGCQPGMMIIKKTSGADPWYIWHRDLSDNTKTLSLNSSGGESGNASIFNSTAPTATQFSLGTNGHSNENNKEYICYLFAGGASDEPGSARSVDFDGSGDYLSIPASTTDFNYGASDSFTMEAFVNMDAISGGGGGSGQTIIARWAGGSSYCFGFNVDVNGNLFCFEGDGSGNIGTHTSVGPKVPLNHWCHVAVVKHGTTGKFFINGLAAGTFTWNKACSNSSEQIVVGALADGSLSRETNGRISNARIVMGTAVYTSSFRPPTKGLTNITNTKLLCCNKNIVTGSTVTPGTITANGNPQSSTDIPFDDPAGFSFGDAGENVIKCGSYTTDGNEDATVNLGWEPQWVLTKSVGSGNWRIFDSLRGLVNAQDIAANNSGSKYLEPNDHEVEANSSKVGLTSTGFYADQDGANTTYIYVAIRRSDGYVGKPPELGSDCFQMDAGNSSSTIPSFDSGFPVDMTFFRQPASLQNMMLQTRLMGTKGLQTSLPDSEFANSEALWDSNLGWGINWNSTYQSWMWKRGQGFDCIAYQGTTAATDHPHQLAKIPEMYWIKKRNASAPWRVYHKGVNGGSNPEEWYMELNTDAAQSQADSPWFAPTSTHLRLKSNGNVQWANTFIAMLFASVDGISKVGYYTGNGSSQTITVGFQPRFLLLKVASTTEKWYVVDTTRGWGAGNDKFLMLNNNSVQGNSDFGQPTSTGFTVNGSDNWDNANGETYIYYAHA